VQREPGGMAGACGDYGGQKPTGPFLIGIVLKDTRKVCRGIRSGGKISEVILAYHSSHKLKFILRILDKIASDMKRETEDRSESSEGLEQYWGRMKRVGREAAMSRINAEKIVSYKEQLRDQTLNVTVRFIFCILVHTKTMDQEAVGIQNAINLNRIETLLVGQSPPKCEWTQSPMHRMLILSAGSPNKVALKPRPPLVEGFVGRDDILSAMHHTHFDNTSSRRHAPTVTILTGLGGSGKTQISLKFASDFEER
jgi:hypothetical protein